MPLLDQEIRQFAEQELNPAGVGDAAERFLQTLGRVAVPALPLAAPEAVETTGAIVAGLVEAMGGWIVLLCLLIALVIYRVMEGAMLNIAGNVPLAGGHLKSWLRTWFNFVDGIENWIIGKVVQLTMMLVQSLLAFIGLGIDIHYSNRSVVQPKPRANPTNVATIADINHLQDEINALAYALGQVHTGTTTQVINNPVPQTIVNQLHAVESSVVQLRKDMTQAYRKIDQLVATDTSLNKQVQQLVASLHDIRHVAVGWQDVVTSLAGLAQQVTTLSNTVEPAIAQNTRTIAMLMPLTMLLAPGLPGLRNLRKLEDNMCQCPKVGNVGNELGTMLAMYEFVTNG